jgi:hypothetical protein
VTAQTPANPNGDRWRLFGAVTTFVRQIGVAQPLVLVLKDLHEADRDTLDLLLFLARNLTGSRGRYAWRPRREY